MTEVPFDVEQANRLADRYGELTGARVEYRFIPDDGPSAHDGSPLSVIHIRFYFPDGRSHGCVFIQRESSNLENSFSEARDGVLDWLECHKDKAA